MLEQLSTTTNGVKIVMCFGEIPDHLRTSKYGCAVVHPCLPDGTGSDKEFEKFLNNYRGENHDNI